MVYKIELNENEANQVIQALVKEPYMNVVGLIDSIQRQAVEQQEEAHKPVEE